MRVVGVIAEYNPLHNGHIYHLEQARQQTGADFCIVVLSGSFVQRGEPACTDKFKRAEWALTAGADLVLELPSVYAVASAERFALGGVRTLAGTGVVTDLAFGCEETDVSTLYQLADVITSEPPAFREALRAHLAEGKAYPRARYEALSDYGVPERMLDAIAQPNNILAIEYLHAIGAYAPEIAPLPITRIGASYGSEMLAGAYSSATAIRLAAKQGNKDVLAAMPSFVGGPLFYDESFPVQLAQFSDMALYALRRMTLSELAELPDVGEGFENVLYRGVRSATTLDALLDAVKSKRYTMARVKRIVVNALLGVTSEQVHGLVRTREGSYLRVLGFQKNARVLLSEIGKRKRAPMILRNTDLDDCPPAARRCIETDMLATDLFAIATGNEPHRDLDGAIVMESK